MTAPIAMRLPPPPPAARGRRPSRPRPALALGLVLALGAPVAAQDVRPDQVLWINPKGSLSTTAGTVLENALSGVKLTTTDGGNRSFDAGVVQRVTFGDVPQTYADGTTYDERGEHAQAAASFRLAATEADARDVVKAAARLKAARALLLAGATDSSALGQARTEVERFLQDYPQNREVPAAEFLHARVTHLGEDPAAAAEIYAALYAKGAGDSPTEGYPLALSFRAGLEAVDCFLAAGSVDDARQLGTAVEAALPVALSALADTDPARPELVRLQAKARLAEGFALLAAGDSGGAKTFFESQLRAASQSETSLRFGARLGLAEALLAAGNARQAEIEFAQVSAMDPTDRDRVARALVGLAECALVLADASAKSDGRVWLDTVLERYADTPSLPRAKDLLERF